MNNTNKLCMIGNGFDLSHGVNSNYYAFRKYLLCRKHTSLNSMEHWFDRLGGMILKRRFYGVLAPMDIDWSQQAAKITGARCT